MVTVFSKKFGEMSFLNNRNLMVENPENALAQNSIRSRIVSRLYDILPNLKEIDITFQSGSTDFGDDFDYGNDEDDY
jgi:hypothetical protein